MVSNPTVSDEMLEKTVNRFWEVIPPVWDRIRGNLNSILIDHCDISLEQFHILRHIRKGSKSVSQLAEIKHISRPAISQTVDILVEKGYVTRQQTVPDRRCVTLELTPAGNELVDFAFKKNRVWMVERLALADPENLSTLIPALDTLMKVFID